MIFRTVNQGSRESGLIGDIVEAGVEGDTGRLAARLRLHGARRNALAKGLNERGSTKQAQQEPSGNNVGLHNLQSNVAERRPSRDRPQRGEHFFREGDIPVPITNEDIAIQFDPLLE